MLYYVCMQEVLTKLPIVWPDPGRYLLAVSGGVDSMCLLDLMASAASERGYQLVVAHLDHGMRADSSHDARLVASVADRLGLEVVSRRLELGTASEAVARKARYEFLQDAAPSYGAQAILTAHTIDDQLETVVFAALRAEGGRGLGGMASGPGQGSQWGGDGGVPHLRPLLAVSKAALYHYATAGGLVWREDSTNADERYARNYIRRVMLPAIGRLNPLFVGRVLSLAADLRTHQQALDQAMESWCDQYTTRNGSQFVMDRSELDRLELATTTHVLAHMAQKLHPAIELSQERLWSAASWARSARAGQLDVGGSLVVRLTKKTIVLSIAGESTNS